MRPVNQCKANIAAANATVQKTTTEVAELKASIASAEAFQASPIHFVGELEISMRQGCQQ